MRKYGIMLVAALWGFTGASALAGTEVVLYPSGAQVRVEETLPVSNGEISFLLPVDTRDLRIAVEGGAVSSQEERPESLPDSVPLADLRERLTQARERAAALEGEEAAAQSRLGLWTQGGLARQAAVEELEKLDAAMSARVKDLYVRLAALKPQVEKARAEVRRLEKDMERSGAGTEGKRVIAQVSSRGESVRVRYAYVQGECGWQPMYRLDAEPEKGLVRFVQEAEIRQGSGQDWKQVRLTLASVNPEQGMTPAPLPPWRLRLWKVQPRQADMAAPMAAAPLMAEARKAPSNAAPREEATFTAWDLGTRDVPAGKPLRLELAQGEWKADFVRLARPGYGQKATWLMAEVRLPEAVDFPSGEAQYLVDGTPIGKALFSLQGKEADLSFGTDSRVRVDMKQDLRQSGSKGFVGKRQTRLWKWAIEVTNGHAKPVAVRVEDPAPQIGDKAIEVKISAEPAPVVKNHVNTWNLEVPASGKRVIDYTVEASAPEDMPLRDGR